MSDLKSDPLKRISEYVMGFSRTGDPVWALATEIRPPFLQLEKHTSDRSMPRANFVEVHTLLLMQENNVCGD